MSEVVSTDVPEAELTSEGGVPTLTLGVQLAAEREAREWTVEFVASQLNLAPRQIQALETGNYAALPGMASVRGFVRAYAKLLKVDATPLVAMIASEQITPTQSLEPKRNVAATPFSDNRLMSASHRRSSPKTILATIIVILLVIGAVAVERMGGWPTLAQSLSSQFKDLSSGSAGNLNGQSSAGASETASETASGNMSNATAVLPSETVLSAPAAPVAATASAAVSPNRDEPLAKEVANTVPNANVNAKATEAPPPSKPNPAIKEPASEKPAADSRNLLVLKVRQDSWVEVRVGHNALISRLVKAGSTEQVEITGPAALTLGNAAGVDVVFRGSPLETKADAKSNVVRLSLK